MSATVLLQNNQPLKLYFGLKTRRENLKNDFNFFFKYLSIYLSFITEISCHDMKLY